MASAPRSTSRCTSRQPRCALQRHPDLVVGPPPARTAPLTSKQFSFVTQLGSPEFIADVNQELRKTDGIGGVSGNDTIATVTYDATVLNEEQLRKAFADAGYPVK